MFLFELLFVSIIHLVMIGLDIVSFFVVIRVLSLCWPMRPLLALDRVCQPVKQKWALEVSNPPGIAGRVSGEWSRGRTS